MAGAVPPGNRGKQRINAGSFATFGSVDGDFIDVVDGAVGGRVRASSVLMKDEIRDRINKLKRDIEEASDERPVFGTAPDCPPEVEEAFLKQVLRCELEGKKRRQRQS